MRHTSSLRIKKVARGRQASRAPLKQRSLQGKVEERADSVCVYGPLGGWLLFRCLGFPRPPFSPSQLRRLSPVDWVTALQ